VAAAGYGDRRPSHERDEFVPFLDGLRDRAIADLVRMLEPISDVAIYRQTANRRNSFGRFEAWPTNLLVVGDAYCAFNPIYGQGITVAACQALLLRDALAERRPLRTGRLQRRIAATADLAWLLATSEDLRHRGTAGNQSPSHQLMSRWSAELARLMTSGDRGACRALRGVYHLMARPSSLFHPALFLSAGLAAVRGMPPAAPRPAVLESLAPPDRAAASADPAVREPPHQEP
jgi:2-polyprenyl-6-methoxyphenol hydroxylase-like FAD-dependent oxidoreductase